MILRRSRETGEGTEDVGGLVDRQPQRIYGVELLGELSEGGRGLGLVGGPLLGHLGIHDGGIVDDPHDRADPAALYATARWLRTAFSDLTWQIQNMAPDYDLVVVHGIVSGRHTGEFVDHRPDGKVAAVFPPRGRTFSVTRSHWFRMRDGRVAEHWANRDHLGMGQQLGWNPPTPLYLARMMLATRCARRRYFDPVASSGMRRL